MCFCIEVFGLPVPFDIYTYESPRVYFESTLKAISPHLSIAQQLVLLIDGLENLSATGDGTALSWLPSVWPQNVCVVFTTDTLHTQILHSLMDHIRRIVASSVLHTDTEDDSCFEIAPLDKNEQVTLVEWLLRRSHRTLTTSQRQVTAAVSLS
jgi:hypothetical protein